MIVHQTKVLEKREIRMSTTFCEIIFYDGGYK